MTTKQTDTTPSDEKAPEKENKDPAPKEYGGREGPDPVRYGDWENNGICSDF